MPQKPVEAVLLGAGARGMGNFGLYAQQFPHQLKFVAVAEPVDERREAFARLHNIPTENQFRCWSELIEKPQIAPALINATMDRTHVDCTLAALERGYHVLLEKPMAVDSRSCFRIARAAQATDRILQICHTLRYTRFYETLKGLLDTGRAGDLVTVQHNEHVAYWHMAHSFVRGNWSNEGRSAPMILSKSCHDLDLLVWMIDKRPTRVCSFGSLNHFRPENVDSTIPERCTDGCPIESECAFSAIRHYLGPNTEWPVSAISLDKSMEARREAIESGPYGRCVYRCDNDVVDHQNTLIEFEDGSTACFTMQGHAHDGVRTMRYSGTEATIRGHNEKGEILVDSYSDGRSDRIEVDPGIGGHGGGDWRLLDRFCESVRRDRADTMVSSAQASLMGHLLCFAAEKSRQEQTIIDMETFCREAET